MQTGDRRQSNISSLVIDDDDGDDDSDGNGNGNEVVVYFIYLFKILFNTIFKQGHLFS